MGSRPPLLMRIPNADPLNSEEVDGGGRLEAARSPERGSSGMLLRDERPLALHHTGTTLVLNFLLHMHCAGAALELDWSCNDTLLFLPGFCACNALVLRQYCPGTSLAMHAVLHVYGAGAALALHQHCACTERSLHSDCSGTALELRWHCMYATLVRHLCCTGTTLALYSPVSVLYWYCSGSVVVLQRHQARATATPVWSWNASSTISTQHP